MFFERFHPVLAVLLVAAQAAGLFGSAGLLVTCTDRDGSVHVEWSAQECCGCGDADGIAGTEAALDESSVARASECCSQPCDDAPIGVTPAVRGSRVRVGVDVFVAAKSPAMVFAVPSVPAPSVDLAWPGGWSVPDGAHPRQTRDSLRAVVLIL